MTRCVKLSILYFFYTKTGFCVGFLTHAGFEQVWSHTGMAFSVTHNYVSFGKLGI